jgi:hypothetical protein
MTFRETSLSVPFTKPRKFGVVKVSEFSTAATELYIQGYSREGTSEFLFWRDQQYQWQ